LVKAYNNSKSLKNQEAHFQDQIKSTHKPCKIQYSVTMSSSHPDHILKYY